MLLLSAIFVFADMGGVRADTYEIKNLGVDATAKDARDAKIAALKSGQAAAFNLLVRRLAVVADPSKLPQFTNAEIAQTIAGITIEEEKTSAVRYIARLTVRFRAQQVKQVMAQFNIPFADQQASPILLLAVWEGRKKPVLWDNPNPWRDAWSKVDAGNSITPIRLPLGDLTDISLASVGDILARRSEKVAGLKARYGTDYALIARAKPGAGNARVTVDIRGESPMGSIEFIQTYPVEKGNVAGAVFRAAKDFVAALELRWKRDHKQNSIRGGVAFTIAVPFATLEEWKSLRREIKSTEGVGGLEIKSLSSQGALVELKFAGGPEQLAQILAGRGFALTNVGDAWVLERR